MEKMEKNKSIIENQVIGGGSGQRTENRKPKTENRKQKTITTTTTHIH